MPVPRLALPFLLLVLVLPAVPPLSGCAGRPGPSTCEGCHEGLEPVSASHGACTDCHGGNARSADREASHRGMRGPRNPSAPATWEEGCGGCHAYQFARVKSGLMYTNAGVIRNIRASWESEGGGPYTSRGGALIDASGNPARSRPVAELGDLSGELYRKFCSLCHLGAEPTQTFSASHAAGCAACHFPFNDDATYAGGDRTVAGKKGYSASHALAALPDDRACFRCHNRSGRIALSHAGLSDGNSALVPTREGKPGPLLASGGRSLTRISPDVHGARGMGCIDCHTSREVMGEGYASRNLYEQTEVRCEDCHGGYASPPRWREVVRENEEPVRESRNYPAPVRPGTKVILTSKGRGFSNVFLDNGTVFVRGKRSGKLFRSRVITGTPEHAIAGHERLECHACHSRAVPQCYGCHTKYDRTKIARDFVLGRDTDGAFAETEDYRTLHPFPLALNERGRIGPVTPGCQTFLTVVDEYGRETVKEAVARFRGRRQFRFAPFQPHNTGEKAVSCSGCHANPAFLGFGQHVVEGATIRGTLLCERDPGRSLDGFLAMEDGKVSAYAAVVREGARPLDGKEVRRVLAANLCIVCHDRAADPVYRRKLDHRALEDRIHRPLLSGR